MWFGCGYIILWVDLHLLVHGCGHELSPVRSPWRWLTRAARSGGALVNKRGDALDLSRSASSCSHGGFRRADSPRSEAFRVDEDAASSGGPHWRHPEVADTCGSWSLSALGYYRCPSFSVWSSYAAASFGRGDLWSRWRPLHAPMRFLRGCILNLLQWRPSYLDAAVRAHPRPSGFVPSTGLGRRGRRSSSASGDGEDLGPDCVFTFCSKVCFVICEGLDVVFVFCRGLSSPCKCALI